MNYPVRAPHSARRINKFFTALMNIRQTHLSSSTPLLSYILSCKMQGGSTMRRSFSEGADVRAISGCCIMTNSYARGSLSTASNSLLSCCRGGGIARACSRDLFRDSQHNHLHCLHLLFDQHASATYAALVALRCRATRDAATEAASAVDTPATS